jgi:ribosomal protein S18 acetylase RimI-like enzyme
MAAGIVVRRLRGPEWGEFRKLRLDALKSDPMAFGSSLVRESTYTAQKWKEWCRDGASGDRNATFVAVSSAGELIGMVGTFTAEGTPHVWGMWTRPEWRNRGVGRELLVQLLRWVEPRRPGRPIILDVNPSQVAAVRIYTDLGFAFHGGEEPLGHDPPATVRQMLRPARAERVSRPSGSRRISARRPRRR